MTEVGRKNGGITQPYKLLEQLTESRLTRYLAGRNRARTCHGWTPAASGCRTTAGRRRRCRRHQQTPQRFAAWPWLWQTGRAEREQRSREAPLSSPSFHGLRNEGTRSGLLLIDDRHSRGNVERKWNAAEKKSERRLFHSDCLLLRCLMSWLLHVMLCGNKTIYVILL